MLKSLNRRYRPIFLGFLKGRCGQLVVDLYRGRDLQTYMGCQYFREMRRR